MSVDNQTCMERIKKRGRPEEATITMDYLEQLNKSINDFCKYCKMNFKNAFVVCSG